MSKKTAPCGEQFEHNGYIYHVGWMKSIPGKNEFCMWINEQPNGGFKWEFLDYRLDDEDNYQKIYILGNNPRSK